MFRARDQHASPRTTRRHRKARKLLFESLEDRRLLAGFTFTELLDSDTAIPGGSGSFTEFSGVSIDGQVIAFHGFGSGGQQGIYSISNGSPSLIADRTTAIPDGSGAFSSFNFVTMDGGQVAFRGRGVGQDGVYTDAGGSLHRVADTSTPIPDDSGNFTGFSSVAIGDGAVAFRGFGSSGSSSGIYTDASGSPAVVADKNTAVPGASGNFPVPGFGDTWISNGDVSFSHNIGIYTNIGGTADVVADTDTDIPDGSGTFTVFGESVIDGGNVAFRSSGNGIYTNIGGSLSVVADTSTPIEGSTASLTSFTSPAIDGQNIAFRGATSTLHGVYTNLGGSLARVIETGDALDGKTVASLAFGQLGFGSGGLSGDSLAFGATFTDGSSAIFRSDLIQAIAPDIIVLHDGTEITDGATTPIDFGTVVQGSVAPTKSFTVQNVGDAALTLGENSSPIVMVPPGFTLIKDVSPTIAPGEEDTFTVRMDTTTVETKVGETSVATNDADENPFNFEISGNVVSAAGQLDLGFGTQGRLTTDFFGLEDVGVAVEVQPDGKFLVAGRTTQSNPDFALARYTSDGLLDSSFGNGGKVATDFSNSSDLGFDSLQQPDGKIIVAGQSGADFALVRYNGDGSLDTSFGIGGRVTTDFSGRSDLAYVVELQSDGKIVAAGFSSTERSRTAVFAIARYNTNGTLDATFGSSGKVLTDFGPSNDVIQGLAIQHDNKIVVAGYTGGAALTYALARYDVNGNLDNAFGGDGMVTTDFGPSDDAAFDVKVQADGKIVAVGYSLNSGQSYNFAISRYNSDGSLDPTFNGNGKNIVDFHGDQDIAGRLAIDANGKIVVAGLAIQNGNADFALARFHTDGSNDTSFGGGGRTTTDFGSGDRADDIVILPDGRIIAVGTTGPDFAIARYQGDVIAPEPEAEITVLLDGTEIADGAATPIDFGTVVQGSAAPTKTFTVQNVGDATLTLGENSSPIVIVPPGFTLIEDVSASLGPGEEDTFTVQLDATTVGTKEGEVAFVTNDTDENPFSFPIEGKVILPPQVVFLDYGESSTFFNGDPFTSPEFSAVDVGLDDGQSDQLHSGIKTKVEDLFKEINVEITDVRPSTGVFSTVFFGGSQVPRVAQQLFGIAQMVDLENRRKDDNALVLTENFGNLLGNLSFDDAVAAIGIVAAHEIGHVLGALHLKTDQALDCVMAKNLTELDPNGLEVFNNFAREFCSTPRPLHGIPFSEQDTIDYFASVLETLEPELPADGLFRLFLLNWAAASSVQTLYDVFLGVRTPEGDGLSFFSRVPRWNTGSTLQAEIPVLADNDEIFLFASTTPGAPPSIFSSNNVDPSNFTFDDLAQPMFNTDDTLNSTFGLEKVNDDGTREQFATFETEETNTKLPASIQVSEGSGVPGDGALSFATTAVGSKSTEEFTISNVGAGTLEIRPPTSSQFDGPFSFHLAGNVSITGRLAIASGDSVEVFVTFSPFESGAFQEVISIESNDTDAGPQQIVLDAHAIPASPMALDLTADTDTGRFNNDNFTGDVTPALQALASPGLTVDFYVSGLQVTTATELTPGTYEATFPEGSLQLGSNIITATATDGTDRSAPSDPITITLAESRQVVLDRSHRQLQYTQPDGVDVTVAVNKRASADIDLLATDTLAEMTGTTLSNHGFHGRFSVTGTGGLAYVPDIEIDNGNFGTIELANVSVVNLNAPNSIHTLKVLGSESEIVGTIDIGRDLRNLLAGKATLSGTILVGDDLHWGILGAALVGSRIEITDRLHWLRFERDSTMNLHARHINRVVAFGRLNGSISSDTHLHKLVLHDDSDLNVIAERIFHVRSHGTMRGSYVAHRIDRIFSDEDFLASITADSIGKIIASNF